jgi:hypothetical protein
MYSIKLDIGAGFKVIDNDIDGHNGITMSIIRENDEFGNRVLRERIDIGKLIISGDTYKTLTALPPCSSVKIQIWDVCSNKTSLISDGVIFVKDLIIRPYYGIAEIQNVYDSGYSSAIDLNKNKKILLNATRSNNNSAIGINSTTLLLLNALNGTPTVSRVVWDVLDVIKLLVQYGTDATATVVSNFFTSNKYYITTVARLCNISPFPNKDEEFPELSLQDIMQELFKSLTITSRYVSGTMKVLYVEPNDSFFLNTLSTNLERSKGDTFTYNVRNNYETISIGSSTYIERQTLDRIDDYADSGLHSFRDVEVNGCGTCNIRDSSLNLINDWIIDSDYIHTCILSPIGIEEDDYNKIVLIHGDGVNAITTINGANFSYNEEINNNNKILRHIKYVPTCFNKYYGENGNFKANNGSAIIYDIPNQGLGQHTINLWSATLLGQVDQIEQVIYNETPINYDGNLGIWTNNTGSIVNKVFTLSTLIILDRKSPFGGLIVNGEVTITTEIRHTDNTFAIIKNSKVVSKTISIPKPFNPASIEVNTDNWQLDPADKVFVFILLKYKGRGKIHIEFPLEQTVFMSKDPSGYINGNIFIGGGENNNSYIINNSGVVKSNIFEDARNNPMGLVSVGGINAFINEFRYNYNTGEYTFVGETTEINTCYDS